MSYQDFADNITSAIMQYFFGDRYFKCENIEDDREMNHAYEYFNEIIFEELQKL